MAAGNGVFGYGGGSANAIPIRNEADSARAHSSAEALDLHCKRLEKRLVVVERLSQKMLQAKVLSSLLPYL